MFVYSQYSCRTSQKDKWNSAFASSESALLNVLKPSSRFAAISVPMINSDYEEADFDHVFFFRVDSPMVSLSIPVIPLTSAIKVWSH